MKNKVSIIASMAIMVALATATFAGCSKANNDNKLESTSSIIEVRDESSAGEDSKVESSVESQFEESKVESSVESQDESDFAVESSSLSSASEISQNVRASNDESSAEEKSEVETSTEISIAEKSEVESSLTEITDGKVIVSSHIEEAAFENVTAYGELTADVHVNLPEIKDYIDIPNGYLICILKYDSDKCYVYYLSHVISIDTSLINIYSTDYVPTFTERYWAGVESKYMNY